MSSSDNQAGDTGLSRYASGSNAVLAAAAFNGLSSMSSNMTDLMKHKSEHERVVNGSGITKTGFTLFDNSTTVNVPRNGMSGAQAASIGVAVAAVTVAVGVGVHHLCKKDRAEGRPVHEAAHTTPNDGSRSERMRDVDDMMLRYEGRSS